MSAHASQRGRARDAEAGIPGSRRARRLAVAAMFSLAPAGRGREDPLRQAAARAAGRLDRLLCPGALALVTGPSGAGKSSILRALASRLQRRGARFTLALPPAALQRERRAVLDLLHGPLHEDLRLLSRLGLGEAPLWLRPARVLSEGERARLVLALALREAAPAAGTGGAGTLLADEFASPLDRVWAKSLCLGLRRAMGALAGVRLVVASAHGDVERWLRPDVVLRVPSGFSRHGRFTMHSTHRAGAGVAA